MMVPLTVKVAGVGGASLSPPPPPPQLKVAMAQQNEMKKPKRFNGCILFPILTKKAGVLMGRRRLAHIERHYPKRSLFCQANNRFSRRPCQVVRLSVSQEAEEFAGNGHHRQIHGARIPFEEGVKQLLNKIVIKNNE
jgi:hypothetical protein